MTYFSSLSKSNVYANEFDVTIRNLSGPKKRGVLYVHGSEGVNGGAFEWLKHSERTKIITALVMAGFTVVSADLGGNYTWGNDTSMSRITAAKNYLHTLGVLPGKIGLIGSSMGALNALNWAAVNPSDVACVVGMIPVIDLTDVHANNRGGCAASINTAYTGGYSEGAFGAVHNPSTNAVTKFSSFPIQLWYGVSDVIVAPSTVTAFKDAVGASCSTYALAGGHAESTYGLIDINSIVSFIGA